MHMKTRNENAKKEKICFSVFKKKNRKKTKIVYKNGNCSFSKSIYLLFCEFTSRLEFIFNCNKTPSVFLTIVCVVLWLKKSVIPLTGFAIL